MFLLHSPISDQENLIELQYQLDEVEASNNVLREEIKTKDAKLSELGSYSKVCKILNVVFYEGSTLLLKLQGKMSGDRMLARCNPKNN